MKFGFLMLGGIFYKTKRRKESYSYRESDDYMDFAEDVLIKYLDVLFQIFKKYLEKGDDNGMQKCAQISQDLVDSYFGKTTNERIVQNQADISVILDVVCFVYDLTYMYEEEICILKRITELKGIDNNIRIRAIEQLLNPVPEFQNAVIDERKKYITLLEELKTQGMVRDH